MLYIEENGRIRLTRGDTAKFRVSIECVNEEYILKDNDTIEFTIKKRARDACSIVHKVCLGSSSIVLEPNDTSKLEFGRYVYDVQLTTGDGDVYTIIEPTDFEIMPEVTY